MERTKITYVEDVINYIKAIKKLREKFEKDKEKLQESFQVTHIGETNGPECIRDRNLQYSELGVKMVEYKSFQGLVFSIKKT